jgi:thiamine-monophosphate kinase
MPPLPDDMPIGRIGELSLIRDLISPIFGEFPVGVGIGDDCAVIPWTPGERVLLSTDRVPHDFYAFELGALGLFEVGKYLAELNISDVAACGGQPKTLLVNLGLPASTRVRELRALLLGVQDAADRNGVNVVGGDLSDSPILQMTATILGTARQPVLRSGCNIGDSIFTTGEIGSGAAVLQLLREGLDAGDLNQASRTVVADHFQSIGARVNEATRLVELGMTSCIDNTDGGGVSLEHLARSSAKRLVLRREACPLSPLACRVFQGARDLVESSLGPGVDLQLFGTLPAGVSPPPGVSLIGKVEKGHGVYIEELSGEHTLLRSRGWEYFE